jgi:cyclopropane fatty-acyl-phospholipid synthase-like methyltransferase
MSDPFPLYVPPEARRLFQSESLLRRFAQMAHWNDGASLLELHGSLGALAIAKALGCHLTVLEPEQRLADALKERARVVGVGDKVAVQHGPLDAIKFAQRAFDGIFSFGRVIGLPAQVAKQWRPYLAVGGRLGVTAMVKVGRQPNAAAVSAWEARLGSPLLSPRQTLMAVETETRPIRVNM